MALLIFFAGAAGTGVARASADEVTIFDSVGFALTDFSALRYLYRLNREQRVARYTPLGAKSRELSLSQMSDQDLRDLLAHSQPSWTAPEMGYRR